MRSGDEKGDRNQPPPRPRRPRG
ncbi:unnamed protein product [Spirodela intermedia]|uniref:Uncharacterized protein n=2 Tax=Spirodela intermedia TaxID=51605 RepID=A0A7I8LA58_SPIIN|nr:unnamed protein product [Spirodela intermedia]CAA6669227.1 unnamed protein product [Spirodela intermedia]CAA7406174.1 unnamed protein product [Spirodela intermedia]